MVLTIAGFEVRQRLRRISTYIYFLVFCGLSYLFTLMSGGAIPGATVEFGTGGKVLVNSPYTLQAIITFITFYRRGGHSRDRRAGHLSGHRQPLHGFVLHRAHHASSTISAAGFWARCSFSS